MHFDQIETLVFGTSYCGGLHPQSFKALAIGVVQQLNKQQ